MPILKTLGPGLLFSGAAIGVSHLVMSTQAGASYGFIMLLFVIIANVFKYPFFNFGPRYAAITGQDLLDGYSKLGKKNIALVLYSAFTISTLFIFVAAVTIVTAGLLTVLLSSTVSLWLMSCITLVCCFFILSLGHYHYLVRIIKPIIIILSFSTVIAFCTAFYNFNSNNIDIVNINLIYKLINNNFESNIIVISFIIAFMGWMPAPIELSVWHSIWQLEKKKDDPTAGSLSSALLDFNVGYIATAIIAMLFVCLGAFILYGTGEAFPVDAVGFSKMLITLYVQSIGDWSWWVIAIASFTTMFSTTLTLLDAYARVMQKSCYLLFRSFQAVNKYNNYSTWLLLTIFGSLVILNQFIDNMKNLVQVATILSFVTGPLFAGLNYCVMTDPHVVNFIKTPHSLSWVMKLWSYLGLMFLIFVTAFYCIIVIF